MKSNEDQYKANRAVLEAVEDASAAVERKDLAKAKEMLDRGMSLVKERQKTPFGWKTVLRIGIMLCILCFRNMG